MPEVPLLGDGHEEAEMSKQIHGNMKAGSTDKIGFVAGSRLVSDEERTCGRPTRAGTPCRVKLGVFEEACGMHAPGATHGSRVFDVDGDQVISVGKYAYRWRGGQPLAVGDRVLLPENWLSRKKDGPGHWVGVITELGTTYTGSLAYVVDRA